MTTKLKNTLLILCLGVTLFGCEKKPDDPVIPNEEEVITTLILTLTPSGGGVERVFSFTDLDGDGGNNPVITIDTLAANTTYSGTLVLLNQQKSPEEDITEEVKEESAEHQFFYEVNASNVTVSYRDKDTNGRPLGVSTEFVTGASESGSLKITLRHEPNKSAAGVDAGQIQNAGGETDIEVSFNLEVK